MYKIIALDMDGTLLNDQKVITERTKEALIKAREKGVKVVLASGRPVDGLKKYLSEKYLSKSDWSNETYKEIADYGVDKWKEFAN